MLDAKYKDWPESLKRALVGQVKASGCGANAQGGGGFQPGNSCASDGGGGSTRGEATTNESGVEFATGKPVKFDFIRNTESAPPKIAGDPYQQAIEPSGRYLTHDSAGTGASGNVPPGWEVGTIEFENPLVVKFNTGDGTYDEQSWKARLSEAYGGKRGKRLSQAIAKDGHDAIVTVDKYGTSEIVDLTWLHGGKVAAGGSSKSIRKASGCGANKDGGGGFQPGNSCATGKGPARTQTDTQEFKTWFGESKVVDADGEPRIVYHGTYKDFDEFSNEGDDLNLFGPGFYFAETREFSENYTVGPHAYQTDASTWELRGLASDIKEKLFEARNRRREKGLSTVLVDADISRLRAIQWLGAKESDYRFLFSEASFNGVQQNLISERSPGGVLPVYLKIEKLFDVDNDRVSVVLDGVVGEYTYRELSRKHDWSKTKVRQLLESQGFDGMTAMESDIANGRGIEKIWIAFKPTQIKSATGNDGTFDPSNPDIRKSVDNRADWPKSLRKALGLSTHDTSHGGALVRPDKWAKRPEALREHRGESDDGVRKASGCGANAEGGGGFQKGNTCASEADNVATKASKFNGKNGEAAREKQFAKPSTDYKPSDPKGSDTSERFITGKEDGKERYTPERSALHEAIFAEILEGGKVKDRTFTILGGGAASGKSTLIKNGHVNADGAVTINADDIKGRLPEYNEMLASKDSQAAAFTHEESSQLSKEAMGRAASAGYDYMLDGTGDSTLESLRRKTDVARKNGYKVNAEYVTVDTELAVQRNLDRAKKTGRMVPPTALKHAHEQVSVIFPQAIKEGLFDSAKLWDTNESTREADKTKLVAEYANGKLTVHDEEAYKRFLAKAKG